LEIKLIEFSAVVSSEKPKYILEDIIIKYNPPLEKPERIE